MDLIGEKRPFYGGLRQEKKRWLEVGFEPGPTDVKHGTLRTLMDK